jgi:putative ABC transport system permease protein
MIRNYFKIAWRSLKKNKLQTIINVLGLTVGTLCCIAILVHINGQLGFDTAYDDTESLYRVRTQIKGRNGGADFNSANTSPPFALALKEDFPEVEEACRIVYFGESADALMRIDTNQSGYYEPRGYVADPTFFTLFNYQLIEGSDPEKILEDPNSIVLSSTFAQKLFGDTPALGKTIIMGSGDGQQTLSVSAVFDDTMSVTSHLNPNYILSMNAQGGVGEFVKSVQNFATQNFVFTYLKLSKQADVAKLEQKLPNFLQARGGKDLEQAGMEKTISLQAITDIHLYSKGISNQIDKVSNIEYLYVLLFLAFFIQLVACVNFVNLSTARAGKRAREIGVRKVVGAGKGSLIRQFMSESVLLSSFATIISIPLYLLLLPYINQLTTGDATTSDLLNISVLGILILLGIVTGLLAGIYPALVLSSVKPIKVLKGTFNLQAGNGTMRKTLVVFQFVVSISLIATVITVTQQLKYAQSKDMGFAKEKTIAVRLGPNNVRSKYTTFKTQFEKLSGVSQVAGTDNYPSAPIFGDMAIILPGGDPKNSTLLYYNGLSPNYFETVDTELLVGRALTSTDSTQIVVNKAAIDALNIPLETAQGTIIIQMYEGGEEQLMEIVGVTQNYHFNNLKTGIAPLLNFVDMTPAWLVIKSDTDNFKSVLTKLEDSWRSIEASAPFEYAFIDKEVEKLYAEEQRLAELSLVFSSLAIFISCLGLFGLISFMAEQKKKEIGIRKVLGASVQTVVQLLTRDFIKLVFIAFLIATPIAYYVMQDWLQDFTYRIDMNWWVLFWLVSLQ